jgi:hypothetical protein
VTPAAWIPEAAADSPGELMIFAAPPPRANMGSLETTITIVAAAIVKNNFRDFFMTGPQQNGRRRFTT